MSSEITIFLRKTNGKGQKVEINSETRIDELYNSVQSLFKIQSQSFDLIFHGLVLKSSQETLSQTGIISNSIVHIVKSAILSDQITSIRIFFLGSLYQYESIKNSTVSDINEKLKEQIKRSGQIRLTYQGRILQNEQIISSFNCQKDDILSAIFCEHCSVQIPIQRIQTKITESITIATTENNYVGNQITTKQYLRKSSMKSSHESRQRKDSDVNSEVGRAKSEAEKKKQSESPDQVQQRLSTPWLLNQKWIETESINCEDEYMQQPELWTECFVTFKGENYSYTLECTENHRWFDIRDKIHHVFLIHHKKRIQIEDSQFVRQLQNNCLMLKLAKLKGQKNLPQILIKLR